MLDLHPKIVSLCELMSECPGVIGIVLGGSRARGKATTLSDVDLGLFYDQGSLDWEKLAVLMNNADVSDTPPELAPPGMWGQWMNGGGWLNIAGDRVDVLLRETSFVSSVVHETQEGRFSSHYIPGHPHGWHSFMLAGEVHYNVPLAGDIAALEKLNRETSVYPTKLSEAIFHRFAYEVRFTAVLIAKLEHRNDPAHVCGLAYRGLVCLAHVICALNNRFVVNEKGLMAEAQLQVNSITDFCKTGDCILDSTTSPIVKSQTLLELLRQVIELAKDTRGFVPSWGTRSFPD